MSVPIDSPDSLEPIFRPSILLIESEDVVAAIYVHENTPPESWTDINAVECDISQAYLTQADVLDESDLHRDAMYPRQSSTKVTALDSNPSEPSVGAKLHFRDKDGSAVLIFGNTGIGLLLDLWIRIVLWTAIVSAFVFEAGGAWLMVAVYVLVVVLHFVTGDCRVEGGDAVGVMGMGSKSSCEDIEAWRLGLGGVASCQGGECDCAGKGEADGCCDCGGSD